MKEPTREAIDALVGSATPHFAYQLRARVAELVQDLAPGDELRVYAEEQMALLDRLGHASTLARDGGHEPRTRPGWENLPAAATADRPLPGRQ